MRERQKEYRLGQDTWMAFGLRCGATFALCILSLGSQEYIDDQDQPVLLRYAFILFYILGMALAFTWFILWARKADEYQKQLAFHNISRSLITAMAIFILLHIVYAFDKPPSSDWPIMAMPAYGIMLAVLGSRPKKL